MRATLQWVACALVALVGAVALGGCDECTDFAATRPPQLLTSGQYTLTARQIAATSLPAVNARGAIAVTVDRTASTLRMRWTRTDGTVVDETWRMRP
jgi:hypothetical protein